MDRQMVTTILTGVGVLVSLFAYLHSIKQDLQKENGVTRQVLGERIGRVEDRLGVLEQRTYDLSTRLPPASAAAQAENG